MIAAFAAAVLAIVVALYGSLVALAFDEEAARVAGVPADGLALTLVVALVVVEGMSTIGRRGCPDCEQPPGYAVARVSGRRVQRCSGLFVAFHAHLVPGAASS